MTITPDAPVTKPREIDGVPLTPKEVTTLYLEELAPKATAAELWTLLTQHARRLPHLSTDVGAGLVQAPEGKK